MYCWSCGYNLASIESQRCPECGRAFDPGDQESYAPDPPARRLRRSARSTVLVLLELATVYLIIVLLGVIFEAAVRGHLSG